MMINSIILEGIALSDMHNIMDNGFMFSTFTMHYAYYNENSELEDMEIPIRIPSDDISEYIFNMVKCGTTVRVVGYLKQHKKGFFYIKADHIAKRIPAK